MANALDRADNIGQMIKDLAEAEECSREARIMAMGQILSALIRSMRGLGIQLADMRFEPAPDGRPPYWFAKSGSAIGEYAVGTGDVEVIHITTDTDELSRRCAQVVADLLNRAEASP